MSSIVSLSKCLAWSQIHGFVEDTDMVCWNQPSLVPQCLLSSLQIFNWSGYFGRQQERDIAVYILKNACVLNKVTIFADIVQYSVPHLKMIKELAFSSRASTTCELVFVECPYEMFDWEESFFGTSMKLRTWNVFKWISLTLLCGLLVWLFGFHLLRKF